MPGHPLLEAEGLVDGREHVGVALHPGVVEYESALPEGRYGLYALELVGLLASVGADGKLVSAQLALARELVEEDVLQEIRLDVIFDHDVFGHPLVQVVEPAHHLRDGALPHEGRKAMKLGSDLAPQLDGLVVVFRGALERRVAVGNQVVVLVERQRLAPANPLLPEYGAFGDGVVHELLLEGAVSHEVRHLLHLLACPFGRPRHVALFVENVHLRDVHAFGAGHRRQHGVLADEVADHNEPPATAVECTEQGLLDPVREALHAALVLAQLVVVEVVDRDVVGSSAAVTQAARGLSSAACEEGATVGRNETAFLPVARVVLHAEVGDIASVELQLGLQVAEQRLGILLGLADKDHDVQLARLLNFEPHRNEDVEMGAFGMAACPFLDTLVVAVAEHAVRRLDLERGARGMLACRRVVGIMREVIFDEEIVIAPCPADAGLLLGGSFRQNRRALLYGSAPPLPFGKGFGYVGSHRYLPLPTPSVSMTNLFCRSFTVIQSCGVTSGSISERPSSHFPKFMKHSI